MNELFLKHKESFNLFCNELLKWNKTHNITGYANKDDLESNIIDSITPLDFIKDFKIALDIGSGCGFPSICLAVIKHNSKFILVEPNNKRVSFLTTISLKLGLKNIIIIKDRIQNIILENKCDLITSRAFDKTQNLIFLSSHLLSDDGYFLFYKGSNEFKEKMKDKKVFYFYKQKLEC
ncbi:16S rRNA (guanine(527)-N(7))-methyltransferase RsmG [Helicobacter sp. MIT 14-3879]|uniref:16S rRNA (guanine(527)-N(7))-methyltransferase RsmG n=1 Tax=Helicobacter sp. MIT 14-3879 TaxID=2040649 RepID=UPI000E1F808D|nr:16S rRNA (guanine(527)-N(7))-methyltransferase RsmG [Helicobacter sp. MIT 14-3879]RDU62868.1 16S rRNA (guanine(527)-N(7))-methyltransferase RsmG [Helicobacter sp. MIT 14-3879]